MLGARDSSDPGPADRSCAVFDFDGVLYNSSSRWKIADMRLGVVGSRVLWHEGLALFDRIRQRQPDLALTQVFTPDEFAFGSVGPGAQANLTTPAVLRKTAQNHLFRGHDLFLISRHAYRDFLKANERFFGAPGPLSGQENPFDTAHMIALEDISQARAENRVSVPAKFERLVSMLRRTDGGGGPFARIFLYFTEAEYPPLVDAYLKARLQELEGGRNALVLSYIAEAGE